MTNKYPKSGPVLLETLLGDNVSTKSLKDGVVTSELVSFAFDAPEPIFNGFKPLIRDGKYDLGELAIVSFLQAKDHGKPLVLLPATIGARFQHHCVAYNSNFQTLAPADLNGKRIGVRSYSQTTGAWIRGILQNDYGVDPSTIRWVTFEDAHVAEYRDPPNVERAPQGKKLVQMLFDGELDAAMLGNDMPKDPQIRPVIPDPKGAAAAWHARTGVVPMNHMVVVRPELSHERPDVVREVYRLFMASRDLDVQPTDGVQLRKFGVKSLRPSLEMIIDYALQQKIIGRRLAVDELFDDTTGALGA